MEWVYAGVVHPEGKVRIPTIIPLPSGNVGSGDEGACTNKSLLPLTTPFSLL